MADDDQTSGTVIDHAPAGVVRSFTIDRYEGFAPAASLDALNGTWNRIYRSTTPSRAAYDTTRRILGGSPTTRKSATPQAVIAPVFKVPFAVDPRVVRAEGILGLPRKWLINLHTEQLLVDSFPKPPWVADRADVKLPGELSAVVATARRVPGVTYCYDTRHRGFGHLLLEGLSQLWALEHVACDRILFSGKGYGVFRELFARLSDKPLLCTKQPVRYDTLIVASQSYYLGQLIDERYVELCRKISAMFATPGVGPEKIYVSRRRASKRILLNEAAVEAEFERRGFAIIYPEQVPLVEQIRLFAGARLVAGPVGSALYNIVFSARGTQRLILAPGNFYTNNDLMLGAFTANAPHYVFAETASGDFGAGMVDDWSIDLGLVVRALDRFVKA